MRQGHGFLIGFLVGFTQLKQQHLVTGFALGLQEELNQSSHSVILKQSDKSKDQEKSELTKSSNEERIQPDIKQKKILRSKL